MLAEGHEVFALDWLGFGASDKPLIKEMITFELHMKTLQRLFEHYSLSDAYILAHDWGGCVALCTIPDLPASSVRHLTLLNSFFPPRVSDISLNCYLLYLLWFSATGILDGLLPEEMVMRYMSPTATSRTVKGFSAPFPSVKAKAGVGRFAHMVPGMPFVVYDIFKSQYGLLVDGICPPQTFSSLHEQARLRERGDMVRKRWASGELGCAVNIVFGNRDPLLRDFWGILVDGITTESGKPKATWVDGAGHYPLEERAEEIVRIYLADL